MVRSVGFVVPRDTKKPDGTCFLVTVPSERVDSHEHAYVVTDAHNTVKRDVDIWMTTIDEKLEQKMQPADWWRDLTFDIAVSPWSSTSDHRDWNVVDLATQTYQEVGAAYGDTVLYAGLLTPVASMGTKGQQMVRSATLGSMSATNVEYGNQTVPLAHLIDCRSWRGFSGSPCWLERVIPVSLRSQDKAPANWEDELAEYDWYGSGLSFVSIFGMLVGYTINDHGVGVVVPIEKVAELIMNDEELKEMRERDDEAELLRREKEDGIAASSASESET